MFCDTCCVAVVYETTYLHPRRPLPIASCMAVWATPWTAMWRLRARFPLYSSSPIIIGSKILGVKYYFIVALLYFHQTITTSRIQQPHNHNERGRTQHTDTQCAASPSPFPGSGLPHSMHQCLHSAPVIPTAGCVAQWAALWTAMRRPWVRIPWCILPPFEGKRSMVIYS